MKRREFCGVAAVGAVALPSVVAALDRATPVMGGPHAAANGWYRYWWRTSPDATMDILVKFPDGRAREVSEVVQLVGYDGERANLTFPVGSRIASVQVEGPGYSTQYIRNTPDVTTGPVPAIGDLVEMRIWS